MLARLSIALLLMTASGFAGLGYQIVWTQQASLWLGHESAAVLAVIAAFFGGLSLGAFALAAPITRSARPLRWYAACELLVALWSVVLSAGLAPLSAQLLALTGSAPSPLRHWSIAFCGTFILLLPATAAMGASLPAMERVTAQWRKDGHHIAPLYAANTLGALLGVLASTFLLLPTLGLRATALLCATLNLLCGVIALLPASSATATTTQYLAVADQRWRLALRLALTGLLGIGFEVVTVRVLSQVAEDTVYTFALLLAVYLFGTALGAALYHHARRYAPLARRFVPSLYTALAAACLLGAGSLWLAPALRIALLQAFGGGMLPALSAETALAMASFIAPTMVMGALFAQLCRDATASGLSFGNALGCNTLGAAVAPVLFGVLVLPAFGAKLTLLAIATAYVLLNPPTRLRQAPQWAALAAVLMTAVYAPPLRLVDVPPGGHIVSYEDGVMATVSVVEDDDGTAILRIDNREQEGSTSSLRVDARQALLPLLLQPRPTHALFLGLGTGVTATAASLDRELAVDAVELLPEVVQAAQMFLRAFPDRASVRPPHMIVADARRYVRTAKQHYDVIVADNYHPARSGTGVLYTVEHFTAVRDRLSPDGLFCQWLPLHQLDLRTLRSIVRSFLTVYSSGMAIVASNSLETPVIGLVARRDGKKLNAEQLDQRMQNGAFSMPLAGFGLDDIYALLGSLIAGPQALADFAGEAAPNTDDFPLVAYRAPRITYAPDSAPGARLLSLLQELHVSPDEVLESGATADLKSRLAAYWQARDRFIAAGLSVRPSQDVQAMLAQVRTPLLAVLRLSRDFRPAYDPLVHMASALMQDDPADARALLEQLSAVQPDRSEALLALRRLDATLAVPR